MGRLFSRVCVCVCPEMDITPLNIPEGKTVEHKLCWSIVLLPKSTRQCYVFQTLRSVFDISESMPPPSQIPQFAD